MDAGHAMCGWLEKITGEERQYRGHRALRPVIAAAVRGAAPARAVFAHRAVVFDLADRAPGPAQRAVGVDGADGAAAAANGAVVLDLTDGASGLAHGAVALELADGAAADADGAIVL